MSIEDARDLELVDRVRRGENAAWSELVTRYQDRLFSVCVRIVRNRDLASDLTQDAFVKIIRGIDQYDGRAKLSTWLIRITMNVCLSKLRAEKLRRHASLEAEGSAGRGLAGGERDGEGSLRSRLSQARELGGEDRVERDEERSALLGALDRLDEEQRAILLLRDAHGMEYEQIAEVLGIAVGTVKSRLFRARGALRTEVERGLGLKPGEGGKGPRSGGVA